MRLHRTYILRLLIDTEHIDSGLELHGSLQALEDEQTRTFKSTEEMLARLLEFIHEYRSHTLTHIKRND